MVRARPVATGLSRRQTSDHTPPKTPWHFWVGVVAAGGYLIWRAFEGVFLLF